MMAASAKAEAVITFFGAIDPSAPRPSANCTHATRERLAALSEVPSKADICAALIQRLNLRFRRNECDLICPELGNLECRAHEPFSC